MGTYNEQPLQVACLGRPLELGMLYDCRSENVIPGVTLWNKDVLQNNTDLKKREHSQFDIITEDTLDRKAHSFDIDANAKLSFLCGLISVEGSAKYLENKKSSHRQARVTMKYQCTTFFEQLTMEQLAIQNIQYKDVFDKGTATHLVTGVLYGVDAVFIFDREVSQHEDCHQVEGFLKAVIKKIPTLSIEGEATVKINEEEEKEINKFHCTFYGDLFLKENPTIFEDAVRVYRNLPKLVQETARCSGSHSVYGVPQKVYLYPLSKLDSRAAKLVRIISSNLVGEAETLLETLSLLQLTADDLIKEEVYDHLPGIRQQLVKFKALVSRFATEFQQKMAEMLPKIRGGGEDEVTLADKIKQQKKSPFDIPKLEMWIDSKKQESCIIEQYRSTLKDCAFVSQPGELEQHIHDSNMKHVLALSLSAIATKSHPFLEDMTAYLDSSETEGDPCESFEEHWFDNDNIMTALRRQAGLFAQFASVNKNNSQLKCVVIASADVKIKAHSPGDTFLFVDGSRKLFQPPSPPGPPEMVSNGEYEMELKWTPPESGIKYIVQYIVTCRLEFDVNEESLSCTMSQSKEPSCKIKNLAPNTAYVFKVAAVCEVGNSEYSSPSHPFATLALPSLAERILDKCKLISPAQDEHPAWYMLPLTETYHNSKMQLKKFDIGVASAEAHTAKVMLVVGATGAGKTTLINGMVNYLFGVRLKDKYRLKLIDEDTQKSQAHSQTQYITAYTIHRQPGSIVPYSLTIIDTPGYGDTRGIEQDVQITKQIKEFFEMSGSEAIDQLDAVGFVSQASVARLTDTQKYVFDSILSMFGCDIADNIFMMLTFADGRSPPALDAFQAHNLPYKQYFKFNNSVFTQESSSGTENNMIPRDSMTDGGNDTTHHMTDHQGDMTNHQDDMTDGGNDTTDDMTDHQGAMTDHQDDMTDHQDDMTDHQDDMTDGGNDTNDNMTDDQDDTTDGGSDTTDDMTDDMTDGGNDKFDKLLWKLAEESFSEFFKLFSNVAPQSLKLTREVLHERNRLEASIEAFQRRITFGVNQLEQIRQELQMMDRYEAQKNANEQFTGKVKITKTKPRYGTGLNVNCLTCSSTCHENCIYYDDNDLLLCSVMNNLGQASTCTICRNKCPWNSHTSKHFCYEDYIVEEDRTFDELKTKYDLAIKELTEKDNILMGMAQEYNKIQADVLKDIETVRECLSRLDEIAMKRNPLTTVEYIDILIQSTKNEKKSGWEQRLNQLEIARKRAIMIQQMMAEGKQYDPFKEMREEIEKQTENQTSIKERVEQLFKSR